MGVGVALGGGRGGGGGAVAAGGVAGGAGRDDCIAGAVGRAACWAQPGNSQASAAPQAAAGSRDPKGRAMEGSIIPDILYHIWTSGCQMNVADSQRVASALERLGYRATPAAEQADVIVLNTCR